MDRGPSAGQPPSQISETYWLGSVLTVVGGFLDAHTYLIRGGVFANAQTGNLVLLALNASQCNWGGVLHYLTPVGAFALGIIVSELVRDRFRNHPAIHWRQVVVAAEFLLLLLAAFLPCGEYDSLVNVAVSFVCAMQVETFRKIRGNALATTMCTGNLRSGTELLYHGIRDQDRICLKRAFQYYGIILCFILGAAIGVWSTHVWGESALLLCCGLLAGVFAAMFLRAGGTE